VSELNGGGDPAADAEEVAGLSGMHQVTVQRKQLRPNCEASQRGYLTVMRYPFDGPIECLLCTWEPIKVATSEAFHLAIDTPGGGAKSGTGHRPLTSDTIA